MQTFNYKPKSDIKTLFKNYFPLFLAVVLALFSILRPTNIRLFRIIMIPYPITTILITLIAAGVVVYYVVFKMPRLKRDSEHSKPIAVENGVVKYTKTKGGMPKEITFNIADADVYYVDEEDDDEFAIKVGEEDITFYANYFDDDVKYQEFKKFFNIKEK